ncbi:hypothetical protein Taro_010137 [Colocasia esculenta]|uniref:Secreted protein n=1 Tax=Colocasia esculenta TaxID=4460 RepID=A0A843UC52_COLES|nr:hypothetical protein [Colocasia esculenta]
MHIHAHALRVTTTLAVASILVAPLRPIVTTVACAGLRNHLHIILHVRVWSQNFNNVDQYRGSGSQIDLREVNESKSSRKLTSAFDYSSRSQQSTSAVGVSIRLQQ